MSESIKNAAEELKMQLLRKAGGGGKNHKYIKRIPHPNPKPGRKWLYFYNQQQVKDYNEKGIIPGEEKKKNSIIDGILSFFGLKNESEAEQKVKAEYEKNKTVLADVSLSDFANHLAEYLNNKAKWDALLRAKLAEKKEKGEAKPKEKKESTKEKKPKVNPKFKLSIMQKIAALYGGAKDAAEQVEQKNDAESGKDNFETISESESDKKNGEKVKSVSFEDLPILEKVESLTGVGGKRWQQYGKDRVYFNEKALEDFAGFSVTRYKTGAISSASIDSDFFDGISNTKAYKIIGAFSEAKLHFDVKDGKFHWKSQDAFENKHFEKLIDRITEAAANVFSQKKPKEKTGTQGGESKDVELKSLLEIAEDIKNTPGGIGALAIGKYAQNNNMSADELFDVLSEKYSAAGNKDKNSIPLALQVDIENHIKKKEKKATDAGSVSQTMLNEKSSAKSKEGEKGNFFVKQYVNESGEKIFNTRYANNAKDEKEQYFSLVNSISKYKIPNNLSLRPSLLSSQMKDAGVYTDGKVLVFEKNMSEKLFDKALKKLKRTEPYDGDNNIYRAVEEIRKESNDNYEEITAPVMTAQRVVDGKKKTLSYFLRSDGDVIAFDISYLSIFTGKNKDVRLLFSRDMKNKPVRVVSSNGELLGVIMPFATNRKKEDITSEYKEVEGSEVGFESAEEIKSSLETAKRSKSKEPETLQKAISELRDKIFTAR
jgi:hypothetical protein